MRILLDESLPRTRKRDLREHDFVHVTDLGWHGVKNGELLRRAAAEGFVALVTADRNLEYQQVVSRAGVGVVVVHARTNRIEDLRPLGESLQEVLKHIRPGELLRVGV